VDAAIKRAVRKGGWIRLWIPLRVEDEYMTKMMTGMPILKEIWM